MKKLILAVIFVSISIVTLAQELPTPKNIPSVEKSMFGMQMGLEGIWFYHEGKLTKRLALRSEVGLQGISLSAPFEKNYSFAFAPMIALEPRFYYSLNKRSLNGKDISGNAGEFFGLRLGFMADRFPLIEENYIQGAHTLEVMPTWGIRRNLGKRFHFEASVAAGYRRIFANRPRTQSYSGKKNFLTSEFNFRLGYRFK